MDRTDLERLDREGLVMRAQAVGIRRARVLTRPELIDELLRLDPVVDPAQLKRTRGFFGRARDLLSRVVERGLHLPDAADRLRAALGNPLPQVPRPEPQAVPTVTLAEIYAAQGHKQRAIETLKRVIEAEPDHGAARSLLDKLQAASYVAPPPPLPPEPDEAPRIDEIGANLGSGAGSIEGAQRAVLSDLEPAAVTPSDDDVPTWPGRPTSDREQAECVAIPIGVDALYVWWRLGASPERDRVPAAQQKASSFVVRAVIVVPTWDGPQLTTRDVACASDACELFLRGLPDRAVVRVAIGFLEAGTFTPIAHSPALETTASRRLACWTLEGAKAVVEGDPRAASIELAADAAARAVR